MSRTAHGDIYVHADGTVTVRVLVRTMRQAVHATSPPPMGLHFEQDIGKHCWSRG